MPMLTRDDCQADDVVDGQPDQSRVVDESKLERPSFIGEKETEDEDDQLVAHHNGCKCACSMWSNML